MTELLANGLVRRAGSPGLVDSEAVRAEVVRKLGRPGRLFPVLKRLLARAAADGAGGLASGALPRAAPFAFGGYDPVATPLAAPFAPGVVNPVATPLAAPFAFNVGDLVASPLAGPGTLEAQPRSQPLPADGAAQHLVRVSRRGSIADIAHESKPMEGGSPPSGPSPVATRGAGTRFPSPPPWPWGREGPAGAGGWEPTPRGGGQPAARGTPLPLDGSPAPPTDTIGWSGRSPNQGSPAVSHTARLLEVAGHPPSAPAAPAPAAVRAVPRMRELRVSGGGRGAKASRVLAPEAASLPAARANRAPAARTVLVSELRRPAAPRRSEIAASEVSTASATGVPELPGRARPEVLLVLPAPLDEASRRANGRRPTVPLAAEPASNRRTQVEPNLAVTVASRPAPPAAAALASAELERFAEKVGRIIARQVAVERERRGR